MAIDPRIFNITVADTGLSFPCREDEFVLAAMLRARSGPINHGCCGGGCGVCRMRIVKGDYRRDKPMSRAHVSVNDEAEGIALLCCIKAQSDLTIAKITKEA